ANGDKVWDKTFGGSGDDRLYSIIATSDGGFLLAGASESSISGNKTATNYGSFDYWVVKINTNGDKVWDKTFGGSGFDGLYSIIATSDDGFLLAGHSNASLSGNRAAPSYGSSDYWMVKINANGDKVWDKAFGGSGEDGLTSIIATSDGGFLLGGRSSSPVSRSKTAPNYGVHDFWVVKVK
ncbi:MAG: T9SS C-terminal target domain-containing protein, partial [Cytophagales bacterium]